MVTGDQDPERAVVPIESVGAVAATWRRSGVTGRSNPVPLITPAAQAPSALTAAPHGMCIHDGYMYYCDAGLTAPGPGSEPAQICRVKMV